MRQINKVLFIMMLIALMAAPAFAKNNSKTTRMVPSSFAELAKQAKPGVVNIQTVKKIEGSGRVYKDFFGQPFGKKQKADQKNLYKPFHRLQFF